MRLRASVLSALLVTAGCTASAVIHPADKPRNLHAVHSVPVARALESDGTGDASGAATQTAPPPDAGPPSRPTAATTKTSASSAPKADPFGDVGFKEINEKEWLAGIRNQIAQREKVTPTDVRFSPGLLRAAFVRSSSLAAPARPGGRAPVRRHEIVVVDNQGRRVASFRPIVSRGSDEPPGDLQFLSEERLVYEVIVRAPTAAPPAQKKAPATKRKNRPQARAKNVRAPAKATHEPTPPAPTVVPALPPRLFVIQPVAPHARPIRCEGVNFAFAPQHDQLAFVGGKAGTGFVAVDGAQVYPRRGHTIVASAPVWSKDGHSLAFLEQPAAHPARLVLVAALDNPTGDTTWDLPADAKIDGASVSWAGAGKLVVRRTALHPIFSATFVTER